MIDLNKLSTARLLARLEILRKAYATPNHYYDSYDDGYDDTKEWDAEKAEIEYIKKILSTREHYPRGAKGRQLRQKAKQNR